MWWLKCHCVEPRLLAGWHGARCARITNATQTQKKSQLRQRHSAATPPASPGHPPTRKTDFLLALTFSARHAALLVVLAVQLALVVVVGAARATAPVADPGWVPGLVSRLDGQHEVLGEADLLCRRR